MSNGQRNIKQKSTILAIILVIYIYVPYFANILENTFKISSLYEYIIYMMLAIIAIGTTMSMNKRVLTFLFVLQIKRVCFTSTARVFPCHCFCGTQFVFPDLPAGYALLPVPAVPSAHPWPVHG